MLDPPNRISGKSRKGEDDMEDQIETIAIALQATLDSVRCSPEPISGEEALSMLNERLQDDGIDLRVQFTRKEA
jgi:hypothetical protein